MRIFLYTRKLIDRLMDGFRHHFLPVRWNPRKAAGQPFDPRKGKGRQFPVLLPGWPLSGDNPTDDHHRCRPRKDARSNKSKNV